MTCDMPAVEHGVVPRPCTDEVKDRNWDEVIAAIERLEARDTLLAACIGSGGSGGQETFPFRLTANLSLGGTAAAVKRSRAAGAWVDGAAIVVKDAWNCGGRFWGRINDVGMAWQDQGTGEYIVTSLQTIARWVRYTLDETLTTDHATATVNHYWDGCDPADGSGDVVVYDPRGMFKKWHCKGCKGLAVYNERNARYEIVDAQLMAKFWTATLESAVCVTQPTELEPTPTIPSEAVVNLSSKYSQSYYSADAFKRNGDAFAQVTAKNPYGHVGEASSEVLVMVSDDDGDTAELCFTLVDMKKAVKNTLPIDNPFTWDDNCSLSANLQLSAIEACGDTVAESIPIPFASKDVIDSFELLHGYSPETCSIVAHTRKYCMIDREMDGDDVPVATMTKIDVVTDWYVDLNNPGPYQYYDIKVSQYGVWVPCIGSGVEVPVHTLRRQDSIDSFTHVDEDSPEECTLTANTKETWVFGVPDPAVDGNDIPCITFEKHEVLIDIDVTSSALYQDTVYLWVPCSKLGNTVSVISTSECPAP